MSKTEPAWPASKVVTRAITDLIPRATNSRTHSAAQIEKLAGLMLQHGWTTAVLVDETGTILAGHGRVMAAAQLLDQGHGQFARVPVMEAVGWSEAAKRAYVIADNQVAALAGWDEKLLGSELRDLAGFGIDMNLLGFDTGDLRRLFDSRIETL